MHASYSPTHVEVPKDLSQAQTFVLRYCLCNFITVIKANPLLHNNRPGSVMYCPGGYWHQVACDDDEGSLSINFSIITSTWYTFCFCLISLIVVVG